MEDEKKYSEEDEIREIRWNHSLSIDEMVSLAEQVPEWRTTQVLSHWDNKDLSHYKPSVMEFQGKLGNLSLVFESSSANSFSRWYRLSIETPLNILGAYKEKEGKCVPKLRELYWHLEDRYIQSYFNRVKTDLVVGLEEARRLTKK